MPMPDSAGLHGNKPTPRKSNPLTLFLSGDVMTGRGIDQIMPYSVDPVLFESYVKNAKRYVELAEQKSGIIEGQVSYGYVWGDAIEELQRVDPDVRIINLETAITNSSGHWPDKRVHYRMHPMNSALLTSADIDVCVLGNNHILDWGYEGLNETLQVLSTKGLAAAGAGMDIRSAEAPAVIQADAGRMLVFSYAHTSAGIPDSWAAKEGRAGVNLLEKLGKQGAEKIIHDVESHTKQGDRVVISIHWGGNWGYKIPSSHQAFAHHLIDKGFADLVHGHSSHHPKSIEVYNGRLILYGCGDLINDYEGISGHEQYRGDLSLLYFPKLDSSGVLVSLEMTPMKIHRLRLQRAAYNDIQWLAEQLNRVCRKFNTSIEITDSLQLKLRWKN